MTITPQRNWTVELPPMPTVKRFTEDGTEFVAVFLKDEAGANYEVHLDAADWNTVSALTPRWRVVMRYEKPQIISTDGAAWVHACRTYGRRSCGELQMQKFLMQAKRDETVHFHDGNPFNMVRSNLVTVPKGTRMIRVDGRLVEKPKVEKPLSAKEKRVAAAVAAYYVARNASEAVAGVV